MNIIDILRRIKSKFNPIKLREQIKYDIRCNYLINKMLSCHDQCVSDTHLCESEVIVSLTTHGKRLYDVSLTVESIMQGTMKPNRIILWLEEDLENFSLPIAIQKQQKRGLEVKYYKNIRSYKKLIPTLCNYPSSIIVTIDDDLLFEYDMLEKLVGEHLQYPSYIITNRMHRITLNGRGRPKNYKQWQLCIDSTDVSPLNFFTGGGGTLYPPQCLDPEVLNEDVFMDICKFADDVWFNAMALKASTKVKKCYTRNLSGIEYLTNENVQDIGLYHIIWEKNA